MDHSTHIRGPLCKRGHETEPGSGSSWRRPQGKKTGPCVACGQLASRKYRSTPKGNATVTAGRANSKATSRAYDAKPEVKARRARRQKTDSYREYQKEYRKTYTEPEEGRKRRLLRMASPAVKTQQKEYRDTPEAKDKANARVRHRLATDENFALVKRLRSRLASAFRRHSAKGKTLHSQEYGIDYQAIISHVGPCPGPRDEWHLDHIRPIASFNWNDPTIPKQAFAPENHQWLPTDDNLSKGARWAPTEI